MPFGSWRQLDNVALGLCWCQSDLHFAKDGCELTKIAKTDCCGLDVLDRASVTGLLPSFRGGQRTSPMADLEGHRSWREQGCVVEVRLSGPKRHASVLRPSC